MNSDCKDRWSEHLEQEVSHSIRHVSIRQLLKADFPYVKSLFKMNGKHIKRVVVVGNVLLKTVVPNQIAYKLDDGSGIIMARFWRDPTQAQKDSVSYDNELRFVRAIGELNEFQTTARGTKTRSLLLQSLDYIEDPHEIFYHITYIIVDTQTALHGQSSIASAKSNLSAIGSDLEVLPLRPQVTSDSIEDEEFKKALADLSR
ncbi:hypothetical protein J3R30DRAFT_861138 [Lentinula aciculospora]|uniref:Nucleic acid-binding protein n=1 Tax=Lentinula aciculospora TaxID=153920 RepID=A0A9W9AS60_9AGAR|nr:hypothetical protein J3R30DRAFT_861138 [Lentinula aciculospora]